jgi:hypothetical protein
VSRAAAVECRVCLRPLSFKNVHDIFALFCPAGNRLDTVIVFDCMVVSAVAVVPTGSSAGIKEASKRLDLNVANPRNRVSR